MFFMHGGAGYTRFIQNIGTAFTGVFFPFDLLIIPKIIPGFIPRFSKFRPSPFIALSSLRHLYDATTL